MRRGRSTQVSVFDPESSGNRFSAEFKLTGDGGSPYEFGIRFSVDGDYFALGGLSMGDMVRINREFARVIREAKHARVVKRFLLFCAVFVALIFAVVGFWLLLGVTCSCAVLVLADMPERLSGRLNRGLDV